MAIATSLITINVATKYKINIILAKVKAMIMMAKECIASFRLGLVLALSDQEMAKECITSFQLGQALALLDQEVFVETIYLSSLKDSGNPKGEILNTNNFQFIKK